MAGYIYQIWIFACSFGSVERIIEESTHAQAFNTQEFSNLRDNVRVAYLSTKEIGDDNTHPIED